MNLADPHAQKKPARPKVKACGAKTRKTNADGSPKLCPLPGTGTGGRCRFHGGASLAGADNPNFVHGRRSKYLPAQVIDRYGESLTDPELLQIQQDVALIEALLTGHTLALKANRLPTEKQERRILGLIEQRRKLIDQELKRLTALGQMVTLGQFLSVMKVVGDLFREFVDDPVKRREIQKRLQKLLLKGGGDGGSDDGGGSGGSAGDPG